MVEFARGGSTPQKLHGESFRNAAPRKQRGFKFVGGRVWAAPWKSIIKTRQLHSLTSEYREWIVRFLIAVSGTGLEPGNSAKWAPGRKIHEWRQVLALRLWGLLHPEGMVLRVHADLDPAASRMTVFRIATTDSGNPSASILLGSSIALVVNRR